MSRDRIIALTIPILYLIGIVSFFGLISGQSMTVANFIGYASSLSTVIMVLVYVLTTSRQLQVMHRQLEEIKYSRNVQSQPLIFLEGEKLALQLPRYYVGPQDDFMSMRVLCRLSFMATVRNIGNGPAISIDFIPSLAENRQGKTSTLVESTGERIECISLREGDQQRISFLFIDRNHEVVASLLERNPVRLHAIMLFKNALGMTYKEEMEYIAEVDTRNKEDMEILKKSLKILKTADIDFSDYIRKFESLKRANQKDEAKMVFDDVKAKMKNMLESKEKLFIHVHISPGSFSVNPIAQPDYQRYLDEREAALKRIFSGK